MRLNPKEKLFDQPILRIREIVRLAMNDSLRGQKRSDIELQVSQILHEPFEVSRMIIHRMITEGYLRLHKKRSGGESRFELTATAKGRRFGIAKANPAISREKADVLLRELIEQAIDVNKNNELVYYVQTIKVFGSYLSEKKMLGDLDVAIKLGKRYYDKEFINHSQIRIDEAHRKGKNFQSYIDQICWPQNEVWSMLKSKKKGLSIHDEDGEGVLQQTEWRTVYVFHS